MHVTLASHDDYLITHHLSASRDFSRPLVITFGGQPSGRSVEGFGTGWCRAHGLDSVYVAQRKGTQYQGLDLDSFANAVGNIASGRDVVCYGSSLGAYAALYFGGCINARIVAAAPMLPAYPPLNRAPDRIPILHMPLPEAPSSTHSPIILYDPTLPSDSLIVADMVRPAYPDARYMRLEYAGHTVLNYLAKAGVISPLIWSMITQDQIIDVNLPTETSPIWLFNRGRVLLKSAPTEARSMFERSLELEPAQHVLANLINLLLRRGWIEPAQELVERALQSGDPRLAIAPAILDRARDAGIILPV